MSMIKKIGVTALITFVTLLCGSLLSTDPISSTFRKLLESNINTYVEHLTDKVAKQQLSLFDKSILHIGAITGITLSKWQYPEASTLLYHYLYGDGSNLELDADYFKRSTYLTKIIKQLDQGEHGPLPLKQHQDWRLSLAFNPYYLNITADRVRLFHPEINFAPISGGEKVMTIVPIGKMKLKIYDNLISAMNPKPFYVYSEWNHLEKTTH
jgi:hypothetical protein